jgi:hypothetical protein
LKVTCNESKMKPQARNENNNNWKEKTLQYSIVGSVHHYNKLQDNHYSL